MKQENESIELRKHLFKQLDRLSDPNANLDIELKRADALAKVGTVIVNSHKQEVDLLKLAGRKPAGAKTISLNAIKRKTRELGNGK